MTDFLENLRESDCTFADMLVCRGPHIEALMSRCSDDESRVPSGTNQRFITCRFATCTGGEQHNSARLARREEDHGENI